MRNKRKNKMNVLVKRITSVVLFAILLTQNVILAHANEFVFNTSGFQTENNSIYYYEDGIRAVGERYIEDETGKGN